MNICLFTEEEISKPLKAGDERAVHIKKILHKGQGDSFAAGIIEGPAGTATITKIGSGDNEGDIYFDFAPESDGKPLFPLHMIIGFPRPIQLKRLLRDMAALGVASVRLCGTELGEKSYLKASLSDPKEVYKMLLDGSVQAGSTHIPKVYVHKSLKECLDALDAETAKDGTVASLKSAAPEKSFQDQKARPLLLALDNVEPKDNLVDWLKKNPPANQLAIAAIGSERGWSPSERSLLEERAFTRLGMGQRIMRTETACTVSASIILSAMGVLG
ncbi:MAG: 16S rRNA (uracil(1498)-N(3))-methyltransferase [Treponema sp.]|nr:16S rRNA (uracil(1498)-N(3))-methyltransferase [Treponema sp.]